MQKLKRLLPAALFLFFIYACFIVNIVTPDRKFSENENRDLAQAPKAGIKNIFDGDFMSEYERYITDQFFARDAWVTAKTYSELALGKTDVNDVFICGDGLLIKKFGLPDAGRVAANAGYVEAFAENAGIPVYFTLIPGAVELWADVLPANAQNASQKELIDGIRAITVSANYIDTYGALNAHRTEAIYYKTDHHWTSLGAYYGYAAFAEKLGFDAPGYPEPFLTRGGFFGTASSACGLRPDGGDTVSLAVKLPEGMSVTAYEADTEKQISAYETENLDKKDKYTVFFGGNYPLMVIRTGNSGKKLLLVKDSYANAELPFFIRDFSEIHVVDLRYYKKSIADYIAQNGIDEALVSYSVANFVTDSNLLFLTK